MESEFYNIAERLVRMAELIPDSIAIAEPLFQGKKPRRDLFGKREYAAVTFAELNQDSDQIAAALQRSGVEPGMRLALMVRQGIDFISLVFALYKTGATLVLIDPGMGVKRMLACLSEAEIDGFVGVPEAQIARLLYRRWFPKAKHNLTVGNRYCWGGLSLSEIRRGPALKPEDPRTKLDDPAAIIFTSGSTGVAKGVLYTYRMFKTQVEEISKRLNIQPGGVDLVGFPFFGLFNAGMGTTAIIPDMDSTKPGSVNPELFLEAADDWKITQSFGSPALWNRVVDYCLLHNRKIETLKRAVIAGAPVSFDLLKRFRQILPDDAEIITPYGATESLPLAAIESREVLEETCFKTSQGKGICVGKFFDPPLEHKIIPISDVPIP
ncbi:MAG: AMP-binding protein, partial [Thermoguttaceae bacterium]|nr:AMP-binding protein [Thermoguttaceae bacterium]